jgi:hypothetical protein
MSIGEKRRTDGATENTRDSVAKRKERKPDVCDVELKTVQEIL